MTTFEDAGLSVVSDGVAGVAYVAGAAPKPAPGTGNPGRVRWAADVAAGGIEPTAAEIVAHGT